LQQTLCRRAISLLGMGKLLYMVEAKKTKRAKPPAGGKDRPKEAEWTRGLKKLYDSVVDEPLPDAFQDLLSKLDSGD